MDAPENLTVEETAAECRVSHWTVRGWLRREEHGLKAIRAGRRILIRRSSLEAFLQASTEAAQKSAEAVA